MTGCCGKGIWSHGPKINSGPASADCLVWWEGWYCETCPKAQCSLCKKLSEIPLAIPYLGMGKAKKKREAHLLADVWIRFPQTEGITRVVSCHWSYTCWCLLQCSGGLRNLVAPWWDASCNLFFSLTGVKFWFLAANCFMVTPETCIDSADVRSQIQPSLEAVCCLLSKFSNKTLRNSIWWFGWNKISRQGKRNISVLWFLVL